MTTITASDFKKHYGEFFDKALTEPVIIQKHHRNSLVMIAFDVFEKLQNRVAELISGDEAIKNLTLLVQE